MATITYNNLNSPSSLITLTDVPNILKVKDSASGSKAVIQLKWIGNLTSATTSDDQWHITLYGETISNVLDYKDAVNKSFYISRTNQQSTAASVARALRNCPNLAANFNVDVDGIDIYIRCRDNGSVLSSGFFSTDIPSGFMVVSSTDGSASSSLNGALIDVDVYSDGNYITTLEKNWYNGEAAFDMSPVLTTISKIGEVVPYSFKISSLKGDSYSVLGSISNNYTTVGYMVNQGYKYLTMDFQVAQNYSRGESREFDNNTILYLYEPSIDISLYTGAVGGFSYSIDYLDSAFNNITPTITATKHCSSNELLDLHIPLNHSGYAYFPLAFYIDLTIGTIKIRYNVIKPLKATEYSQRILWRNSYGGISFIDLTGQRSETRSLELTTYQKNIFDYYDSPKNELNKAYDNVVDYVVTLKSHLFEHDGKYIYNDLMQSSEVWTEINGETYAILIESVSVEEQQQNNIYEATVKYKYSMIPSLL